MTSWEALKHLNSWWGSLIRGFSFIRLTTMVNNERWPLWGHWRELETDTSVEPRQGDTDTGLTIVPWPRLGLALEIGLPWREISISYRYWYCDWKRSWYKANRKLEWLSSVSNISTRNPRCDLAKVCLVSLCTAPRRNWQGYILYLKWRFDCNLFWYEL